MRKGERQRGVALAIALLVLLFAAAAWLAVEASIGGTAPRRERVTDQALSAAREALVAYAADRAISAWVGPGYLPCPDRDNDGWAEATCGSLSGDSGQDQRIGRLPWKTLGLPDLRDGHGERLWYAVSSKYKGLLNCAPSRGCVDMSPDAALGTLTVRDAAATLLHDGTSADPYRPHEGGALAVIIAPGAALEGQARDCRPGDCDAAGRCLADPPRNAAPCDPSNYLDRAEAEDNADFVDRNDLAGRARNANGFIQGPARSSAGVPMVNDRVAIVGYQDVVPRVMKRVALEVAHCLRHYASRPENGGRYPWPTPACRQNHPDPALAWADANGVLFGRVPDTPFDRTRAASGGRMLPRWWRAQPRAPEKLDELPTRSAACRIAYEPDDENTTRVLPPGSPSDEGRTAGLAENAWWSYWKPFVFYALAPAFRPGAADAPECAEPDSCLALAEEDGRVIAGGKHFAVLVAGTPLSLRGLDQRHGGAALGDARHWLEGPNAELERMNPNPPASGCPLDAHRTPCMPGSPCNRITLGVTRSNDVVVAFP